MHAEGRPLTGLKLKPVLIGTRLIAAVVCGAAFSWFASNNADGLEWSIAKVTGGAELESGSAGAHAAAASVQEKTAFLPDYGFKQSEPAAESDRARGRQAAPRARPRPGRR